MNNFTDPGFGGSSDPLDGVGKLDNVDIEGIRIRGDSEPGPAPRRKQAEVTKIEPGPAPRRKQAEVTKIARKAIELEYRHGKFGLVLGVICVLAGVALILNGATGSVSWTVKYLGLESQLNDAAPGVVLCVIGALVALITRPNIRIKDVDEDR